MSKHHTLTRLAAALVCAILGFALAPRGAEAKLIIESAANPDQTTTHEDVAVVIPVLANDVINGNLLVALNVVSSPAHGSALVNPDTTITYTPAPDFSGTDTFTYSFTYTRIGNNTVITSNVATVTVTVNPVNDAPSFTKGPDQAVLDNAGPQAMPGWATNISAGPANEAGQTLSFVVGSDNPALFAIQPAISPAGTLTYAPAAGANGTATVTAQLHDNGGTANGGVDTSPPQSFSIVQSPNHNQPPVAVAGPAQTVEATGPTTTPVTLNGANSSDPDGDALTYTWSENSTPVATGATAQVGLGLGAHTLTLAVDDGKGGSASDEIMVNVVDTTPPVVTLNGDASATVECPASFTDPGATAADLVYGAVPVTVSGSVNTEATGTYVLTYTATDHDARSRNSTCAFLVVLAQ